MSIWVVNTSPLVFLGNPGWLELLRHAGREVYIPRAVAEEIAEKPDAATQAGCPGWLGQLPGGLALIVRHFVNQGNRANPVWWITDEPMPRYVNGIWNKCLPSQS